MVTSLKQMIVRKRAGRVGIISVSTAVALLVFIWVRANALQFVGGAYGCGGIDTAIANAEEGRTVIPMVPERNSGAAVITKSIVIQGGWNYLGAESDCANQGANPSILGKEGLRAAGFVFQAPITRSALSVATNDPILTIDSTVEMFAMEHMILNNHGATPATGGGLNGVIDNNAMVRLTNVLITETNATDNGGGFYLEVRGGSHLMIEDSEFSNNVSDAGGAFEIHVYDNSEVTINNTVFDNNEAQSGNGGAGRIVVHSGSVNITNSFFTNNSASGTGGALAIEGTGGEVCVINSVFENNSASSSNDVGEVGSSVTVCNLGNSLFLPFIADDYPTTADQARITNITLNDSYAYEVEFETLNYTAVMPGQHVHIFFNTVSEDQAGVPGSGPWAAYAGSSPFTGYDDTDKPPFATHMCILVANQNHSIQPGTGNCHELPVNK